MSGSMEHHLSIFRPYERDAKHEDQLTRPDRVEACAVGA